MKSIGFTLLLFLLFKCGFAQYTLTFCEDVNKEGKAYKPSNTFMISTRGSVLKLLFKSDEKLTADKMDFKIFYIDDSGKEAELTDLAQKIEAGWNYAWKEIVFFDPGDYRVKVYGPKGNYLTSANLKVKQQ